MPGAGTAGAAKERGGPVREREAGQGAGKAGGGGPQPTSSGASSGSRGRHSSSGGRPRHSHSHSHSHGSHPRGAPQGPWLQGALSLLLWMVSSSLLIILNKRLMVDDGFKYPLALTGLSQLASVLGGWLMAWLGWMSLGPAPTWRLFTQRLLPVVVCAAGSLYYGNVAYLHLSVAFIQILKVLTPAMTLTICALAGLERINRPLLAAVGMITAGTLVATVVERGPEGRGFSWAGLAFFLLSALLESLRVVYIQTLLGRTKYNALEVLVYLGPATGFCLLGASCIWEGEGLFLGGGWRLPLAKPLQYGVAIFMGFFVNLGTACAIKYTSSLTLKVWGCVKNTFVVWFGVLMGDTVTPLQCVGYGVSVAGFALYTYTKGAPGQEGARRPKKGS